jgi:phosphate transport system permease protein
MNNPTPNKPAAIDLVNASLARRYASERRFRRIGLAAVISGLLFVSFLFISIIANGYQAFWQTHLRLEIVFDAQVIDPRASATRGPARRRLCRPGEGRPGQGFPEVKARGDKRDLNGLVSSGAAFELQRMVLADPGLIGQSQVAVAERGRRHRHADEGLCGPQCPGGRAAGDRSDHRLGGPAWRPGRVAQHFNTAFFTSGDSREPELAGIGGAVLGSFYALLVTLLLSFPIGVAAAVYLEEFAPRNRWTDLIEVNINNLAAVPSIVFGLLGLAVFINFFGLPRSAPLVGGLVLTLMTLPTIIIASRAALKAVPPSIREAALGVGASKMQMVFHHVLPLAMPGMLTGAIIGMAQALGESAPLLMIGMVAFIVDLPQGFTDPATALPVQIYLWADSPERAFVERTSAAIMVLLAFLLTMNALAVILRKKFERRW